ncbi:hypothetical protein [Kordia sp.]|uniref:hypothetical protein n=1 Tax=Kordia sp. TaxID=1965332 RepID=UPI003D2D737B
MGNDNKMLISEKIAFIYLPIILSLFTAYNNILNDNIQNILSICLSILIGLLLNLLILIISNLSTKGLSIENQKRRVELIEETFFNIAFSIVLCILGLINLILLNICMIDNPLVFKYHLFTTNVDINSTVQFILSTTLYFLSFQVFITLFIILKRIVKIFQVDINLESKRIKKKEKKEMES